MTTYRFPLPACHTITVSVPGGKVSVRQVEDGSIGAIASFGADVSFGPYLLDRSFDVFGVASVTIAESDPMAKIPTAAEKAILAGIPTVDPADDGVSIWSDNGVLKVSGASV